jgi:GGDEF domain-containing protein
METFKDENDFYQEGEEREEMDQFYKKHRNFGLRAKHELKRAERYCEFLSLLIVDLSSLSKFAKRGALKSYRRMEVLSQELEALILKSVRETDLVSGIEDHKLLLLLSETPKEGARSLAKRLEERVKHYVSNTLQTPPGWQIPMNIFSYPDRKGKDKFLSFIQEITQS